MRKPISLLCAAFSLTLFSMPVQASVKGEACRSAVEGMQATMARANGVQVSGVESFNPADLGYAPRDRTLGYTFSLVADSDTVNLLNSPVTMCNYAQQVADGCHSVAMVTFWLDSEEGGWGETYGVDEGDTMFKFNCIGSGSPEARQNPLPWGAVICG